MARLYRISFLLVMVSISAWLGAMSPMLFSSKETPKPDFNSKDKKRTPHKNPLANKPYAQLKKGKEEALKKKDLPAAIKHIDAMIGHKDCPASEQGWFLRLELADLNYDLQEFTKAEKIYNEFVLLYPGSDRCDYAHYRAIICGWKLSSEPDRDQTKTQETLKMAQEFLKLYKKSEYTQKVEVLAEQCQEKLFLSDVGIFNFHFKNKNFKAAQRRLDLIGNEHIANLPKQEPLYLELSVTLAQAQNNTLDSLRKQIELAQKFPDHERSKKLVPDLPSVQMQLAALEKESELALVQKPVQVAANKSVEKVS